MKKGAITMKKTAAIAIAVILIAAVFAGCNGTGDGKVTDTTQDLGGAMTEMATDISDMFDGDMTADMTDDMQTESDTAAQSSSTIAE